MYMCGVLQLGSGITCMHGWAGSITFCVLLTIVSFYEGAWSKFFIVSNNCAISTSWIQNLNEYRISWVLNTANIPFVKVIRTATTSNLSSWTTCSGGFGLLIATFAWFVDFSCGASALIFLGTWSRSTGFCGITHFHLLGTTWYTSVFGWTFSMTPVAPEACFCGILED